MRKYLIMITSVLVVLLLFVAVCIYYTFQINPKETVAVDYTEEILSASSWIELTQKDIDLLVNDTYSDNMKLIIASLEKGMPLILYVQGGFSDPEKNGNYLTLSAFDTEGNVIVYDKTENGFMKTSRDFYMVMEAASAAFILTESEVLS